MCLSGECLVTSSNDIWPHKTSFANQTPIVQGYQDLPEGSHSLKERIYLYKEHSHLRKDEWKALYCQGDH